MVPGGFKGVTSALEGFITGGSLTVSEVAQAALSGYLKVFQPFSET